MATGSRSTLPPTDATSSPTGATTSASLTPRGNSMTRALVLCVWTAAVVSIAVLPAQQADTTRNPLEGRVDAAASGRRLYDQTCQACHGAAGQGDRGPALDGGRFTHGSQDDDLFHVIRTG